MDTAPQQKHLENPFQQQTDETDVIVNVGDETLHLHSGILSFYSPVLREKFLNQQKEDVADGNMTIRLNDKKLEHVVAFFMFFYPEHQNKIMHEQMMITADRETIENIFKLSQQYQTDWIQTNVDHVLASPKHTKELTKTPEKKVEILMLANEYQLDNMVRPMIKHNGGSRYSFSFRGLQQVKEFEKLKAETKINIVDYFYSECGEGLFSEEKTVITNIIQEVTGAKLINVKKQIDTLNQFGAKDGSDVIVKVEEHTLHLHSAILCHCSPVFKAMLSGNFKEATTREIILKDKKAEHVIMLFGFCYSGNLQKLKESTNYEELLSLCEEYQMDWLVETVEQYLIDSKRFSQQRYEINLYFTGLFLADKFNLNALRKAICSNVQYCLINMYDDSENFKKLSKATKYHLARSHLHQSWKHHEKEEVLKCLDSCTNY